MSGFLAFIANNGYILDLDDEEAFELTMAVARGELAADDIEKRMRIAPVADLAH